ncbi:MAG: Holliday junction branch migration DNA helicase RuvB [Planctomycetota bacterium]
MSGDGEERFTTPERTPEDADKSLRPTSFEGFVGQARVVKNLRTWIKAAQVGARPLDHVLFTGPPGLGKTTLANLVAGEMGARLEVTSGPVIEKSGDLAGVLIKLRRGDVLFIDEVHRLRTDIEEYLYSAMEDYRIDLTIDEGPNARTIGVNLQRFTLVGATTRAGLLTKPFRDRFGIHEHLKAYPDDELEQIVRRSAGLLGVEIEDAAAALIATRSRGTPRVANRFLARLRDVAVAHGDGRISVPVAERGLAMLGVDERGLDEMDRRILSVLAQDPGNAVGLKTLAVATSEEEGTIEDVYEPHLIRHGYLRKTPRGRVLGPKGYELFGLELPSARQQAAEQGSLFA